MDERVEITVNWKVGSMLKFASRDLVEHVILSKAAGVREKSTESHA